MSKQRTADHLKRLAHSVARAYARGSTASRVKLLEGAACGLILSFEEGDQRAIDGIVRVVRTTRTRKLIYVRLLCTGDSLAVEIPTMVRAQAPTGTHSAQTACSDVEERLLAAIDQDK